MASVSIRRRKTSFQVRFRLGGRSYPLVSAGTFRTLREARLRRDVVAAELALGRNPADLLRAMTTPPQRRTFADWAERYLSSRVDLGDGTRKVNRAHVLRMLPTFGERDLEAITPADVQEWIASLKLKPTSMRVYLGTLRAIFDFAEVNPNPARHQNVRLPRQETTVVEPPSASDVEAIIANVQTRWRLPLRTLEQTGMRIGELHELEWRDVDVTGLRFRVRRGKTVTARRWVAVPEWLMIEITDTTPLDDRTPERRVFAGFTPTLAKNLMSRACKAAGIAHFHPHDLRHRYASVKIAEGVPVTTLAAQLGHAKKSITLDTYSHVLISD